MLIDSKMMHAFLFLVFIQLRFMDTNICFDNCFCYENRGKRIEMNEKKSRNLINELLVKNHYI